ncbi:centromere protein U [Pimephales promelas]|uniref:centromere protein U n=1 Tax=Pimephales promelas TaxID=90988 RepID=UPI0019559624|nr:centromere protein U [Pimephales promelas]XP_039511012.1 centromere protein U [Pimephales promelas]KAG1934600.1 centromere protein U [Pimephales promelas]
MNRMTKTLKAVQRELQSVKASTESPRALDISSIEKASFFQGDQYSPHGNPLHSTALEEDLSPGPDQTRRSAVETHKAKANEKARVVSKSASSKENQEPSRTPDPGGRSVVRKAKGRPLPTISEGGENTDKRRTTGSEKAGKGQRSSKETSPTPGVSQRQRSPASSEELTDEDESFHPSMEKPKAAKRRSSSRRHKRKSLSSSESAGPAKRPRDPRSATDLDVALDAFQEFVTQYKQSVTSDPVKRSIDAVSRSFEEQISEIITATKELKSVKRYNNKINRDINQKRTRLVEASYELIKEKTKLSELQKDHDEMQLRLRSLREGAALLSSLQELNRKYRTHRTHHPNEVETYGPSCMPAMLMEARGIMGTEHQLKTINDNLQQVLDETENQ